MYSRSKRCSRSSKSSGVGRRWTGSAGRSARPTRSNRSTILHVFSCFEARMAAESQRVPLRWPRRLPRAKSLVGEPGEDDRVVEAVLGRVADEDVAVAGGRGGGPGRGVEVSDRRTGAPAQVRDAVAEDVAFAAFAETDDRPAGDLEGQRRRQERLQDASPPRVERQCRDKEGEGSGRPTVHVGGDAGRYDREAIGARPGRTLPAMAEIATSARS